MARCLNISLSKWTHYAASFTQHHCWMWFKHTVPCYSQVTSWHSTTWKPRDLWMPLISATTWVFLTAIKKWVYVVISIFQVCLSRFCMILFNTTAVSNFSGSSWLIMFTPRRLAIVQQVTEIKIKLLSWPSSKWVVSFTECKLFHTDVIPMMSVWLLDNWCISGIKIIISAVL